VFRPLPQWSKPPKWRNIYHAIYCLNRLNRSRSPFNSLISKWKSSPNLSTLYLLNNFLPFHSTKNPDSLVFYHSSLSWFLLSPLQTFQLISPMLQTTCIQPPFSNSSSYNVLAFFSRWRSSRRHLTHLYTSTDINNNGCLSSIGHPAFNN